MPLRLRRLLLLLLLSRLLGRLVLSVLLGALPSYCGAAKGCPEVCGLIQG